MAEELKTDGTNNTEPVKTEPVNEPEKKEEDKSLLSTPKPEDGKTDKDVGAPEKYEDFNLPEGMEIDKERMEGFVPVAKELGLSQEKAQKLVDFYAADVKKHFDSWQTAWNDTQTKWRDATKADPEVGGANLETSLTAARHVLKELGTPALVEALDLTGMGNHPELVRLLSKIGKLMKEDSILGGTPKGEATRDAAKTLFPNQN